MDVVAHANELKSIHRLDMDGADRVLAVLFLIITQFFLAEAKEPVFPVLARESRRATTYELVLRRLRGSKSVIPCLVSHPVIVGGLFSESLRSLRCSGCGFALMYNFLMLSGATSGRSALGFHSVEAPSGDSSQPSA